MTSATKLICSLALLLSLTACSVALQPGAEKINLAKSDPASECKELGDVTGSSNFGMENVKNDLRNQALKLGANFVRMETVMNNPQGSLVIMTGTAYVCP